MIDIPIWVFCILVLLSGVLVLICIFGIIAAIIEASRQEKIEREYIEYVESQNKSRD